jgi:hypothetical protein
VVALRQKMADGMLGEWWAENYGLLTLNCRVYLPPSSPLVTTVLEIAHNTHM